MAKEDAPNYREINRNSCDDCVYSASTGRTKCKKHGFYDIWNEAIEMICDDFLDKTKEKLE